MMNPAETMAKIVALRQAGRMEEAGEHFMEDGVLVMQPGNQASGRDAVIKGLQAMSKVFPVFHISQRTVIEAGGIALHHSRWNAQGVGPRGEPVDVDGVTSDVLVKDASGHWKVAIDNPWGGSLLG